MLNGELCLGFCPEGTGTTYPFDKVFPQGKNLSKGFDGVDAVVLWGGTDIHPSYYKQQAHPSNQVRLHKTPSARDRFEWKVMRQAKSLNIPIIGVCRGAQFVCAFAGGSLIQHMSGHHSPHYITTNSGETMLTTSCHHQMMQPDKVEHELLAWSTEKRSHFYEDDRSINLDLDVEPEIVYFPQVRGLAIQGHPEWAQDSERFVSYVNELVRSHLLQLSDAPY